jgi:hypothetical protein
LAARILVILALVLALTAVIIRMAHRVGPVRGAALDKVWSAREDQAAISGGEEWPANRSRWTPTKAWSDGATAIGSTA